MKKRWEKAVSILSSITLLAAAVPAVLLASAEGPVIPDVSSWRYVSIQEYDNQATGKIVWGESKDVYKRQQQPSGSGLRIDPIDNPGLPHIRHKQPGFFPYLPDDGGDHPLPLFDAAARQGDAGEG